MLPYIAIVIKGLRLYNKSNSKHIFCKKGFKTFLEGQTSKDKSTPLLAIKNLLFDATTCHLFNIAIFFCKNICSLQVLLQVISLSHL